MASHSRRISTYQAERGIYLDFEGFKGKPPAIAGICVENDFHQIVLDSTLRSAAEAKNLNCESFCEFVRCLMEECERDNRFIIAFSSHEMSVIQRDCGIDVSRRYKNGLRIAKRWKWHYHRDIRLDHNSLDQFLELPGVDYEVPKHLGKGNATSRLKAVVAGLARSDDYAKLTPTQKGKWTKLLDYNRHDVLGLRALILRAAKDTSG